IAWPARAPEPMQAGVAFFNRFRDLVASGFWSSKIGVEDLRYMGHPGLPQWDGCPDEALQHLGGTYADRCDGCRGSVVWAAGPVRSSVPSTSVPPSSTGARDSSPARSLPMLRVRASTVVRWASTPTVCTTTSVQWRTPKQNGVTIASTSS